MPLTAPTYQVYDLAFPSVGLAAGAKNPSDELKPLLVDALGNLLVSVSGGGGGGTSSLFGAPFPASGTAAGAEDPSGDMAPLLVDALGNLLVAGSITVTPTQSDTSSNPAQTSQSTTAAQILAANPLRKRLIIQNTGVTRIKIVLGAQTPTQTAYHFCLPMGGVSNDGSSPVYVDTMWTGAVQAISDAVGGTLVISEYT